MEEFKGSRSKIFDFETPNERMIALRFLAANLMENARANILAQRREVLSSLS